MRDRTKWLACFLAGAAILAAALPGRGQTHGTPTEADSYFGPLVGADALENFPIGGPRRGVFAYRFRSHWTGTITAVRFFAILNTETRTGYSGGTGGAFRVSVVNDAGGTPGRTVLASADYVPTRSDLFHRLRFPSGIRVQRGLYYDIVFTNPDPDPTANYASIDTLFLEGNRSVRPPSLPTDVSLLWAYGTSGTGAPIDWQRQRANTGDRYFPVVDIVGGAPGQHLGFGYMEAWSDNPKPVGGEAGVRERFVFDRLQPARVAAAWVRVQRTSPAAPPLSISLETLSGRPIATATAAARSVPSNSPGWAKAVFDVPPLLHPRETVALVLSADATASYEAFPVRDGSMFGFGHATVFSACYAQFNSGSGWTGWDQWGQTDRRDGDLQFGLRLVTPDR